jgi:methylglutaconyl-CoA hydratase
MMNDSSLVLESFTNSAATITLNRPEHHNAFNPAMVKALTETFHRLGERNDLRMVILTGSGRSFCAGADLASMKAAATRSHEDNLKDAEGIFDLMAAVDSCPLPVVGRINGSAIGGGVGLVSCCDITVAVDRAMFGFSETRLGLVPAVISPFVIAKIGDNNARELFLTGERFDAWRAKEIGLIQHVSDESNIDEKIDERVQELLKAAPGAVRAAKRLVTTVAGKSPNDLRPYTTQMIAERRSSDEGREGTNAFLEKREPWWRERQ